MDAPRHRRENAWFRAATRLAPDGLIPPDDAPFDWPYIVRAADRQGIGPLLHAAVASGGIVVPPVVAADLHAAYWQHHFRNRALMAELERILSAAAVARVAVMPLKGAVLAPHYYPTPALRPLSDLDFMVQPDAVERFATILGELGYQRTFVRPTLDPHGERPLLREWMFVRHTPDIALVVEYRVEPLDPALGTLLTCDPTLVARLLRHADGMWVRARVEEHDDAPRWRIAPEDLLLHVASHLATRHAGYRLLWLHDLCRIVATDDLDWPRVGASARALRLHAPVFAALEAAHDWRGAPLPLDAIRPLFLGASRHGVSLARVEYALHTAYRVAQADADLTRDPPVQWWLLAGSLLRLRGVRPYLRAIRRTLLPGRAYIAAWRSRPDDATFGGYCSGLLLRAALGAAAILAALSRRARAPCLASWCDRAVRRVRPFALYRPDDTD